MIRRHLIFILSWIYFTHGLPEKFQAVQFLQPATSFAARTDQFINNGIKVPKTSRRHIGINDFFLEDPSLIQTNLNSWERDHGFFEQGPVSVGIHFSGHITPDFSDGLSYPDPFLRTGPEAKRMASYLYSKELFFHNIPHVRGLLQNQEQRRKNGLALLELGSLRPASPWYRFKGIQEFGRINSVFSF